MLFIFAENPARGSVRAPEENVGIFAPQDYDDGSRRCRENAPFRPPPPPLPTPPLPPPYFASWTCSVRMHGCQSLDACLRWLLPVRGLACEGVRVLRCCCTAVLLLYCCTAACTVQWLLNTPPTAAPAPAAVRPRLIVHLPMMRVRDN